MPSLAAAGSVGARKATCVNRNRPAPLLTQGKVDVLFVCPVRAATSPPHRLIIRLVDPAPAGRQLNQQRVK